eukprot:8465650-Alexandrium_andersonii.AAC.1
MRALALAYNAAFEAASASSAIAKTAKMALFFLHELSVLKVCLPGGPWGNAQLVEAFAAPTVFGRTDD